MFKRAFVIAAAAWFTAAPALAQVSGTLEVIDGVNNSIFGAAPVWEPYSVQVSSDLSTVLLAGRNSNFGDPSAITFQWISFEAQVTGFALQPLATTYVDGFPTLGSGNSSVSSIQLGVWNFGAQPQDVRYGLIVASTEFFASEAGDQSSYRYAYFELEGAGADASLLRAPLTASSFQTIFNSSSWSHLGLREDWISDLGIFESRAMPAEGGAATFSPVTPVPEPSTYALMLAGLAAVLWTSRRRRAHQA